MTGMTDSKAAEVLSELRDLAQIWGTDDTGGIPPDDVAALDIAIARLREPAGVGGLQRYYPAKPLSSHPGWQMDPSCDGEWVLFDDVAKALSHGPARAECFEPMGPDSCRPVSWSVKVDGKRFVAADNIQAEWLAARLNFTAAPQPPSEAQAQGGGEVRAKPLEWQEERPGEWCDRHHGFHITQDDEEPQEYRFTAEWGEGDPERFPTLKEAQAWCQEALDRYIREWAVTAPPSAPVGVEEAAEDAAAIDKAWDRFNAALAQQPAALRMAGVRRCVKGCVEQQPAACVGCEGMPSGENNPCRVCGSAYFTSQQPAAIPRLANCGRYTATDNTGEHYYLNHANTWQTFQGQQPAAVDGDYQRGLAFILAHRDAIIARCGGPSEQFVVERTFDALAQQPAAVDGAKRSRYMQKLWLDEWLSDHDIMLESDAYGELLSELAAQPGGAE